jgi:glycosyltransferase involved in cell wall biosynthesis
MGKKITVSAIIIKGGKFDEKVYEKTLDSISWVDEKIIVHSDKFNLSFSDLRNMGAMEARGEWLFYIDTDESVTPELKSRILNIVNSDSPDFAAYAIPRRNIVFGKEMKHIGLWPDYVVRLIRKENFVGWEGELHEQPKISGRISHLKEPLIHHKHDKLADMVEKTNKWSEIEAKLMFEAGHPPMNFLRFASAAFREFWLRIVMQSALLDGVEGMIYGLYQVFSRLISYSKLWELQLREENQKNAGSNI